MGGDVVVFVDPTQLPSSSSNQNVTGNGYRRIIINKKQDSEIFTVSVLATYLDILEIIS